MALPTARWNEHRDRLSPGAGLHLLVNAVTLSRWLPRHPEAPCPGSPTPTPPNHNPDNPSLPGPNEAPRPLKGTPPS